MKLLMFPNVVPSDFEDARSLVRAVYPGLRPDPLPLQVSVHVLNDALRAIGVHRKANGYAFEPPNF